MVEPKGLEPNIDFLEEVHDIQDVAEVAGQAVHLVEDYDIKLLASRLKVLFLMPHCPGIQPQP